MYREIETYIRQNWINTIKPACEDEGAETEQENGAESEDGTVYDNGEANE